MMRHERRSLRTLVAANQSRGRSISDNRQTIGISEIDRVPGLDAPLEQLRGRTILLATKRQLPTIRALVALDGIARRVLLASPDLQAHLPWIIAEGDVDNVIADADDALTQRLISARGGRDDLASDAASRDAETEWVLFTSGTTGRPKMVVHTLSSLTGPLDDGAVVSNEVVWSTFYDVRRYGGLQILLRALVGGGSLVLSDADEATSDFLERLAAAHVTHVSGTPSHWRKALMNSAGSIMQPDYVRLSGEVADQSLLDNLQRAFPRAKVAHAFASTEAGVAFDVRDGLAGFPASFLMGGVVEMLIKDGTLRIRSSRTASCYIGQPLPREDGFIDTGDLVEQRGNRVHFMGRKEGVINVGGLKVFPEEVEAVLNQHPLVRMSRVWPRKNPIVGAVVAADIMLGFGLDRDFAEVREELTEMCRASLARHAVPATWRKVDAMEMTASGKLRRA